MTRTITTSSYYRPHIQAMSACLTTPIDWRAMERRRDHRKHALARLITRVLANGGTVREGGAPKEWRPGNGPFLPEWNTAEHLGEHLARRAFGFGWSLEISKP